MAAMAQGFRGKTCLGAPPDDGEMFVVWGQLWTALEVIPKAIKQGRPFLHIDNGYVQPARGTLVGYYRITYNGMAPVFLPNVPPTRVNAPMAPWRTFGKHVLVALPGPEFGVAVGHDMPRWINQSQISARRNTQRPIIIRPRKTPKPLTEDLHQCWALVTHSSNVAVDAVLSGIPVFVAPTNPAAPVGNLELSQMEKPVMPDRTRWFDSLMAQQFTINEMRSGLAREFMSMVISQGGK